MPSPYQLRQRRRLLRRPVRRRPPWWRSWLWAAFVLGLMLALLRMPGDVGNHVQSILHWMLNAKPDLYLGEVVADRNGWLPAIPALGGQTQEHKDWDWLRGKLLAPTAGEISSEFGWRRGPEGELEFHEGIDYQPEVPGPVVATASGTVTTIQSSPVYGLVVTLDHGNDLASMYGRLSSAVVRQGQEVAAGDRIGAADPFIGVLHFELRYRGAAIDPTDWFGQ